VGELVTKRRAGAWRVANELDQRLAQVRRNFNLAKADIEKIENELRALKSSLEKEG